MKKKIFISLFIVILSLVGVSSSTSQAAETESTYMSLGQTTNTTSRITVKSGEKLYITVQGLNGSGNFAYTIFKNGNQYQNYVGGTEGAKSHTLNPGTGEYSLRLYCNNPTNKDTDCMALGTIYSK